jgi:hypothetical protein
MRILACLQTQWQCKIVQHFVRILCAEKVGGCVLPGIWQQKSHLPEPLIGEHNIIIRLPRKSRALADESWPCGTYCIWPTAGEEQVAQQVRMSYEIIPWTDFHDHLSRGHLGHRLIRVIKDITEIVDIEDIDGIILHQSHQGHKDIPEIMDIQ